MAVYTVLSYNIYGKVFDFNQNLKARLGVLRKTSIKVCMPNRCKSSYKETVWLLSDSKKTLFRLKARILKENKTGF